MRKVNRKIARSILKKHMYSENPLAWFEELYARANDEPRIIPWADLFKAPAQWQSKFDFVLELYTLQVLPPELRAEAARCIASFLAPGAMLLLIARAREPDEPRGQMPWPLTLDEIQVFETAGLKIIEFEDFWDEEDPLVRRFRISYRHE